MTKFSFAVPIANLRDLEPYQDFTFGLSFLLENPEYEKYFRHKCEEGGLVYLDNSFNETLIPATPGGMAQLWAMYHPTAVVSPDSDDWDTLQTFEAFKVLQTLIPSRNILSIFRSDAEREWFDLHSLGPKAVSYWWVDFIHQTGLDRVHFLGLSSLALVKHWQPPSLDTSQMVKFAMAGLTFEDWVNAGGTLKKHLTREKGAEVGNRLSRAWDFFNLRLNDKQLDLCAHNMQALKAYVNEEYRPVQSHNGQLADTRRTVAVATSFVP